MDTSTEPVNHLDFNFDRTAKNKSRIYSRRLALAKAVQKRKQYLFGSSAPFVEDGPNSTNIQRRDAWEEVRQELLRKGFNEYANKTRLDIQKTDWQHVRRYVMDKRKKDSSNKEDPVTELDTVVFDIVKSFGRYSSTRNSVADKIEDNEIQMDEGCQPSASYGNGGSISPKDEFQLEEDGAADDDLTPLSRLLNFQIPTKLLESTMPEKNESTFLSRIAEIRLHREEYLTAQERIKVEIEQERLIQERIRTKILLSQLTKENPEMASESSI